MALKLSPRIGILTDFPEVPSEVRCKSLATTSSLPFRKTYPLISKMRDLTDIPDVSRASAWRDPGIRNL